MTDHVAAQMHRTFCQVPWCKCRRLVATSYSNRTSLWPSSSPFSTSMKPQSGTGQEGGSQ